MAAQELSGLRASVVRVLPQRVGRLYEEGTIAGSSVWTDANPSGPTVSPTARRPGGYEMRWWAPNGDDLVADVLVFANPATAARFMEQAAGARCGHVALASTASTTASGTQPRLAEPGPCRRGGRLSGPWLAGLPRG